VVEHGLGQGEPLLEAGRQILEFVILKLGELKGVHLVLNRSGESSAVKAIEHAVVAQVLFHRQAPGKVWLGCADIDAPANGIPIPPRIHSQYGQAARLGVDQGGEDGYEGGLSRAIGTQEPEDLCGVDIQGEVL